MSKIKKILLSFLLGLTLILFSAPNLNVAAFSDPLSFVILSQYKAVADIGDEVYLMAITSNGKQPTWKSSDSKIASVNTYGIITAKKAGTAVITAKIKGAEASCQIGVNKTRITISKSEASIEHGVSLRLSATTSNDSKVTWKSSKTSIATVDEYGKVTGVKPGETTVTASADGSSEVCLITVKLPSIQLDKSSITLYRGQTTKLSATVSSQIKPTWKTNKKSVAIIDATGTVTAIKHGTAVISATVDGVIKTCEIIVQKPEITLSAYELTLKKGANATLTATVSSNNTPAWSTSNPNVVTINSKGVITAMQKGKAYLYASEDGTKVRCTVTVTE